jgi:hypothetical protein
MWFDWLRCLQYISFEIFPKNDKWLYQMESWTSPFHMFSRVKVKIIAYNIKNVSYL